MQKNFVPDADVGGLVARLDTGWHEHPKVLALGAVGMGVHAWSISYCDATRSDGFIPAGAWPSVPGFAAGVRAVISAGLWERSKGGYRLHDYADYNKLKADIQAEQEQGAIRQKRFREQHRNGVTNAVTNAVTNGVGDA
jgi:hypothetical protein